MKTMIWKRLLGLVVLTLGMQWLTACAMGGQPRMEDALSDLQAARASLEHAEHDKGGHRVRAIEIIDQAIAEVRMGMEVGAGR